MVARRLIPLVVAFAVAFAPVALEACQVSCLSHSVETAAFGSVHHHHSASKPVPAMPAGHVHHHAMGTEGPQAAVVMAGQPRPCDHGDDLPAFSAALSNILIAPAIVAATFEFPEIHARPLRVLHTAGQPSSERIALTTQLRV